LSLDLHQCAECLDLITPCTCIDNHGICNSCAIKITGIEFRHKCSECKGFDLSLECEGAKRAGRHDGCSNCMDEDDENID
jgi:hypothetical protein